MRLPVPTPQQIESFRLLYKAEFGVNLTESEASEVSRRFLQLYYLLNHALD